MVAVTTLNEATSVTAAAVITATTPNGATSIRAAAAINVATSHSEVVLIVTTDTHLTTPATTVKENSGRQQHKWMFLQKVKT